MRHQRAMAAVAAAVLLASAGGAFTIRQYRLAPAVKMHMPATPDSLQKENPYSAEKILEARNYRPSDKETAKWAAVETDTAGIVNLDAAGKNPLLYTLSTRISADRYAKGTLKLTSTSRAAVKVNGTTKITKAAADSTAKSQEWKMELLPATSYDIIIDLAAMPDDKSAPEAKLEFIPDSDFEDVAIEAAPALGKRVTPLTILGGERVYSTTISADGKYILAKSRQTYSDTDTRYRGSITETATGRVISDDVNVSAQWMDRGSKLVYSKKRDNAYDYYAIDVPSMRSNLLAGGIPQNDATISPDGKYLFYYDNVEADKETGKLHRYLDPDDRQPGMRNRNYIIRYDLASHVEMPLTYGGATTAIQDLSADGQKLLYASSVYVPDRFPFYFTTLVQMDMNTLECDTIIKDSGLRGAIYSPDAKRLFITGGPDIFGKAGANYGDHPIGNDFDTQGYIFDIASKKVTPMTRDFDPAISGSQKWNSLDGMIYFTGETGFFNYIYRLDPKSGKITRLDTGDMTYVRNFSLGDREDRYIAYTGGNFTADGEAWVLDLKNGRNTLIEAPMREWLEDTRFGKMEPWAFTATDGTNVDGYICYPPDFDASIKYPMIVYYYGGTSPSEASFRHMYSPQLFASRGYMVYVVNPSGTTGYGQEYSARHVNAWGKRTADEIIQGTKKMCDTHPFIDRTKIGCLGASYGGFMTQYLQTQTDIFAAAVSHAGISNVTSYWGEGYWGYSYNSVAAAKSYPWTDPDLFTKQGSLFNADKIHTPLLLLHGTVDTNVPIGESIQLFNALKILGRDVEFITVEGENHVIAGYENRQLWQNTIMAWFAKYLQEDPSWWNSLYGNDK